MLQRILSVVGVFLNGSIGCETFELQRLVNLFLLDIDECRDGSHKCDKQTTYCSDKQGSYECSCKRGYRQHDAFSCVGKLFTLHFMPPFHQISSLLHKIIAQNAKSLFIPDKAPFVQHSSDYFWPSPNIFYSDECQAKRRLRPAY